MGNYTITGPDGYKYKVTAPEGATEAEILARVQAHVGQQKEPVKEAPVERTSRDWSGVPKEAFTSIPASALQFGKDLIQPIIHPVDTAESIYSLGAGLAKKLVRSLPAGPRGELSGEGDPDEATVDAVGQFLKDRYGSVEAVKKTLATDPVGLMGDVSAVLSGGAAAGARIPGATTKAIVKGTRTVADAVDPLALTIKGVDKAAPVIGDATAGLLGMTSGMGADTVKIGAAAGKEGNKDFLKNMRGQESMTDVLTQARQAVDMLRQQRGAEYKSGMQGVAQDTTALDFKPIDQAVRNIGAIGTYKGKVLNKSTEGTWKDLSEAVDDWRQSDPADFHTPEGFDALKKRIGDIRSTTDYGTPSRVMADQVYHAVKDAIVKQAPDYADVMKDYERASDLVDEVERSLSLGKKASADTALRKLQSLTRNNVNTNYGNRSDLMAQLEAISGKKLMPKLAGQAATSWTPRGLQAVTSGGTIASAFALGPKMLLALPAQSPRVVGELAHGAGTATREIEALARKLNVKRPAMEAAARVSRSLGELDRADTEDVEFAEGGAVDDDSWRGVGIVELKRGGPVRAKRRPEPDRKKLRDQLNRLKKRSGG